MLIDVYPEHELTLASREVVVGVALATATVNGTEDVLQGEALATATIAESDGFVIMASILDADLSGENLGSFAHNEINARLTVNGNEVPITSFNYQVPTGKLGSILNVRLASKDVSLVPSGADIDFDLIVKVSGVDRVYKLMENGKLQGKSAEISFKGGRKAGPTDEITFSAIDIIADRFSLGPRRPVIMYDPVRVKYDDVANRDVKNALRDEQGNAILPVLEPVPNLKMSHVLKRAYTPIGGLTRLSGLTPAFQSANVNWILKGLFASESSNQLGMDFDSVITNIPDYAVKRADFTIEGGWHDGARPCIEMFSPLYYVFENILFIQDVDRKLSYPVMAHEITLGTHKKLVERTDFTPEHNAIILTYQYAANDPSEDPQKQRREVFTIEPITKIGTRGENGYTEIETRRWDWVYYMSDDPDNILDRMPSRSETTTRITSTWYSFDTDTGVMTEALSEQQKIAHRESIRYTYEGDLKVGHDRTVESNILIPSGDELVSQFLTVERETYHAAWTDDPLNHGQKIQDWSTLEVTGICYISDETEDITVSGVPITINRLYPALELIEAGRVTPEMGVTSDLQHIRTEREKLHRINGNIFDVERIEINHLSNSYKKTFVDVRTGSTSTDPYETRSRNVLLRDEASEAIIGTRTPIGVNAYELPREMALELGHRVLRRFANPPTLLPLDLPGVDFAIAQGTVIKAHKRTGSTVNFIVTGFGINGQNLGKQGHRISENIETLELLTV